MKRLTEGAHQTSNDLTVASAAYSQHISFCRTTVHSNMKCQKYSLLAGWGG